MLIHADYLYTNLHLTVVVACLAPGALTFRELVPRLGNLNISREILGIPDRFH